jgi:uncharacterized membrane protein YgcG
VRSLAAAAVLASVASWSRPAAADGGPPIGYGILFEPGNQSRIVVHSEFWGLFDGVLGNPAFRLYCSQMFGGRATVASFFPTVLSRGGRFLVAANFGGLNVSDDGCDWRSIDAFHDQPVYALAPIDSDATRLVAITVKNEGGPVVSRAYTSGDRGDTWTALGGTIQTNVSIVGVAVAPSDPKRIYAVGVTIDNGPRMLAVSKDGGATFAMLPLGATSDYDPTLIKPLSIAGIVPDSPDVVFVRADGSDDQDSMEPDELWVSNDAGQSWKKAYSPAMDLPGFAFTPDGKNLLVAGPAEGIRQAPLADAIAGNAVAFTQIYSGKVWALAFHGNDLYAGNDDYAMKPPFMVGVSTDGGRSFQPIMDKCNVSLPTCGDASTSQLMCQEQWTRLGGYVTDIIAFCGSGGAGGAGGSGGDAGTSSGGSTSGGGGVSGSPPVPGYDDQRTRAQSSSSCSVHASRRGRDPTMFIVVGAAFGAAVARRKRRREETSSG